MKAIVFWDVVTCSLVSVYRRFRGACCLCRQADEQASRGSIVAPMLDKECSSETSENLYQITRRNVPEDSRLRGNRCWYYSWQAYFHVSSVTNVG
jgi:hypothetical protein